MMKTALWALTAMTACSATAVAQNESQRKLVCTYTLGEILDEGTSANKITKKVVNFYDKQGRMFKSCEYGTGTTDEFTLTKMFDHAYAADGENTVCTVTGKQWGLYDFGDFGFKDYSSNNATTTYSPDGRVLKEVTTNYTYEYGYDENNLLTSMVKSITNSGKLSETTTYTNNSEGKAEMAVVTNSTGAFSSKFIYEYDDNGHLVSSIQYKRPSNALDDEMQEYAYVIEEWTYDGDMLTEYVKQSGGSATKQPANSSRKVYSIYNNNPNMILVSNYSWNSKAGEWKTASTLPTIEEYVDFDPEMAELCVMSPTVSVDNDLHTATVQFAIPAIGEYMTYMRYELYRNGQLLATLSNSDVKDGMISYVDADCRIGEVTYFVRPVIGTAPDLAEEDEVIWCAYNASVSPTEAVSFSIEAVSNLRLDNVQIEKYTQEGVQYTERKIVIGFDTPTISEDMGFVKNELYFWNVINNTNYYVFKESTSDANVNTLATTFDPTRDTMDFIVVSHYKYGNVVSEKLTLTKTEVDEFSTAITDINASAPCGNGKVYNLNGQLMGSSLDNLPRGSIVVVNGKKVIVK